MSEKSTKRQQKKLVAARATLRKDYSTKDGLHQVLLHVKIEKKNLYLNIGLSVKLNQWDDRRRRIKNHEQADRLNMILSRGIATVNEIAIDYNLREKYLTIDALKTEFFDPAYRRNFIQYAYMEIEKRKKFENISSETIKMHRSIINKLALYCKNELLFADLDVDFLRGYEKYLATRLHNAVNTINKNMRMIKVYVRRALADDIIRNNPFDQYKIKKERTTPDSLSEEELDRLFELYKEEFLPSRQQKVLRAFLFSCCTGLRISDLKRIMKTDIKGTILKVKPYKTKNTGPVTVTIPLSRTAMRLVKHAVLEKGNIFELAVHDSQNNKDLKLAIVRANIKKNVSFHLGRHTFATHYLRKNKGDIVTLKNLLGHSKIEQTMVYINISEEWLREGMNNFGEWL